MYVQNSQNELPEGRTTALRTLPISLQYNLGRNPVSMRRGNLYLLEQILGCTQHATFTHAMGYRKRCEAAGNVPRPRFFFPDTKSFCVWKREGCNARHYVFFAHCTLVGRPVATHRKPLWPKEPREMSSQNTTGLQITATALYFQGLLACYQTLNKMLWQFCLVEE